MVTRILAVMVMFSLLAILACGTAAPEVVEREVIKEVPVEKIVEKEKLVEVIKTVEKVVVATPTAVPPPGTVKAIAVSQSRVTPKNTPRPSRQW